MAGWCVTDSHNIWMSIMSEGMENRLDNYRGWLNRDMRIFEMVWKVLSDANCESISNNSSLS